MRPYTSKRAWFIVSVIPLLAGCSHLIDQAKSSVDDSIDKAVIRAERSGSAVVAQAYMQADLLRANLMDDVERERQAIETAIGRVLATVQSAEECLAGSLDTATIDAESLVRDVIPWASERPFYLRRIEGGQLVAKAGGLYEVAVSGNGVGALDERRNATLWRVAGQPVQTYSMRAHQVVLQVPHSVLEPLFSDDHLVFVRVNVRHEHDVSRWWWFDKTVTYRTEFSIALLPRTAATIDEVSVVQLVPGRSEPRDSYQETKVDGQDKQQEVQHRFSLPAGAELTASPYEAGCKDERSDRACGHCFAGRNGVEYEPSCEVSTQDASGVVVTCFRRCDPKTRATVIHRVWYTMPAQKEKPSTVPLPTAGRLRHAAPYVLDDVPADNYRISGKTANGARFELLSAQQDAPAFGLQSKIERVAGHFRIIVNVSGPRPYSHCN